LSIHIVTDSTCDLPAETIRQNGIHVIPLYVHMNGRSYLDGYDLSREEFYDRIENSHPHPTTAAPGTDTFIAMYQKIADLGADGIVSIHVAKSLSNTCNSAELAAKEMAKTIPIVVIDSGQLSLGLGMLVLSAAARASSGATLQDIEATIREASGRTVAYAWLNTLDYLRRSGRLSFMKNSLASLLDIKPIMKMENGEAKMESVRTKKRAMARVLELVEKLGPIESIGITHFNASADVFALKTLLQPLLPAHLPIIENSVTPTLGAHVGPGAVCVSCIARNPVNHSSVSNMERIKQAIKTITG
jgi:DegV family protein with EDD domain